MNIFGSFQHESSKIISSNNLRKLKKLHDYKTRVDIKFILTGQCIN